MATETPTAEETAAAEMARFTGGSTLDGEVADGEPTADENEAMERQQAQRAADKDAAKANEATRKAADPAVKAEGAEGDTPEEAAAKAAASPEKAAKPGKKSVDERMGEITAARRAAERRAETAERELADLKAGKKPLTPQADTPTSGNKAPDPKDFEFGELDTKYVSALARFEVKQELAADRKVSDEAKAAEKQTADAAAFQARIDTFAEAGAEKFDAFNDLVIEGAKAGDWALSPTIGELLLDSDYGHEIAHFLASDPVESRRIAELPASAQAAKFGRLEAKFEAEAAAPSSAQTDDKPVKTTKAPAPVKTPRSNSGQFQVDGSTTDFAAFEALAKAG